MRKLRNILTLGILLVAAAQGYAQALPDNVGQASTGMPAILQNVTFRPALNARLPVAAPLTDENGKSVTLEGYLHQQKPVLLVFVYYGCPMLCTQLEQGVVGSLRMLSFNPGRDYDVVFVSFDDRDTPEMAASKKRSAMEHFRRPETASGWHFLTGSKESIAAVTNAANFHFNFDTKNNLFAHASGIMLLTPDGRISRYFYGVDYPPKDLRMGLVEASQGKIGNAVDQVLLYCYHYDPATGKYGAIVNNILKLGAGATILVLGGLLLILFRLEKAAPPRRDWSEVKAGHGSNAL